MARNQPTKQCRRCKQRYTTGRHGVCLSCLELESQGLYVCSKCHVPKGIEHYIVPKNPKYRRIAVCKSCKNRYEKDVRRTPEGNAKRKQEYFRRVPVKVCAVCKIEKSRECFNPKNGRTCSLCRLKQEYGFRKCSCCKTWKRLCYFPSTGSCCRPCGRERSKQLRDQAITAKYNNTPRQKQLIRDYAKTDAGKNVQKRWLQRNPEKRPAHQAVSYAIRGGLIPHPATLTCEVCGKKAAEYHHHKGYSPEHWFSLQPLCHSCHGKANHSSKALRKSGPPESTAT